MADNKGSLPVKTKLPGDVIAKIADATTPSQQLAIDAAGLVGAKLFDGAGTAITSGAQAGGKEALDVEILVGGAVIDPTQIRALTSADVVTVAAITAALPAGSNALGSVNADLRVGAAAVSPSNPVPVSISSTVPGDAIQDFKKASGIAVNGNDDHDYTVSAGKTLNLARIFASSSGLMRLEVEIESGVATDVFATKFVAFNSIASPNISIEVVSALQVADGVRVRAHCTNLDDSAEDLYSTIEGTEV